MVHHRLPRVLPTRQGCGPDLRRSGEPNPFSTTFCCPRQVGFLERRTQPGEVGEREGAHP